MSTQISLKLSDKLFSAAKQFADERGFENLQDFIRETIREKLFEPSVAGGMKTYSASERALAKRWLLAEEDEAWQHLQKEK